MYKQMNIVTVSVLAVIAASAIGCGQGMKSNAIPNDKVGSSSSSSNTEEIAAVIKKAEKANEEAKAAIDEAANVMLTIQDENGNFKINLFQASNAEVNTSGLITPLIDKIRGPLDTVIAKSVLVRAKFNEARQMLMSALARLDDKDPAQAALIAEVMKQMASIDKMDTAFRTSMFKLGGKLDLAVDGLEKILSGVTSFIPGWGWVVNLGLDFLVMQDIRDFVLDVKLKLLGI